MPGPRMFVSGQGISVARGSTGPNPDAMRTATEERIKAGADWVKVYASRGSFQSVDTTQTITFDEMNAIVQTAHAQGRKVAIHSYGPSGVKDAVRAGADSIEHGIDLDDETIAEMKTRGTVWVPTIDHNRYYVDAKDEYGFPAESIPPLQDYIQRNLESARRAVKAGVRLAMGSDAVYSMFGQNTRELGWFVKAGMTPEQALASATTVPAAMMGARGSPWAHRIGVSGRPRRCRRRPAGQHRRAVHRRPLGHEGRRRRRRHDSEKIASGGEIRTTIHGPRRRSNPPNEERPG